MDRNAVLLAKTAKGLDEVKSRAHGPPQKQRTILIMVDGVATAGDILAKFGGIPEIAAAAERCADMLGAVRGKQKAQVFRDRAKAFAAAHLGG
jgi:hypothetical protein